MSIIPYLNDLDSGLQARDIINALRGPVNSIYGSVSGSGDGDTQFTGSFSGSLDGIAATASYTPNALITASANSNEITFTKGDTTQFTITVDTGSGGGIPGGPDTSIQFNSGSVFSGSSDFTFDYTNNTLTLTGSIFTTGSVKFKGLETENKSNVVTFDTVSGQLYYTASSAFGGSVTLLEGPGIKINGYAISASVLKVNGNGPDANGNIITGLSATVTGNSASLVISSSGDVTASLADGLVWVVSNDSTPGNDGDSYIWSSGSQEWYQIAPLDQTAADARYLQLAGGTMSGSITMQDGFTLIGTSSWATQSITASYVTGSIFDSGNPALSASYALSSSFATTASYVNIKAGPRIEAINYNNGVIEITGSIGGLDTQIQFNSGSAFSASTNFTYNYLSATPGVNISAGANGPYLNCYTPGGTNFWDGRKWASLTYGSSNSFYGGLRFNAYRNVGQGAATISFVAYGNYTSNAGSTGMPAAFTFESQYRRPSLNANPDTAIFPGGGTADINASYFTTVNGVFGGSTFTLVPSSGQQNLQNLRVGMFITGAGVLPNTTLTSYNSTANPPSWGTSTSNTTGTILATASLRPWNADATTTVNDIVNYFGTSSINHPTIGLLGRTNQLGTTTVTGSQILTFQVWNNGKTRIGNSNITNYAIQQNLPPDLMLDTRGSIATSGSTYTSASAQGFTDNTAMYFGSPGAIGSWRIILSGSGNTSTLNVERWDSTANSYGKDAIFTSGSTIPL
jgi:hypothetical protein